ncbi:DUF2637 domain-containing protein [Nonomuraea sp. NPDC050383]|uniref:DUF2637 domain-containing protein n=1 Tax=Nonomuraea sp. NPDC050383 TaxID=3364362 RepID=UPI0037972DC6
MNSLDHSETPKLDGKLVTMIAVAVFALIAVVVGAFVLSFDAITAVSEAAHIDRGLSWLMPVSVDGAMTVGTMAALVLKMLEKKTGYAWFVVLTGVIISIACNALHATQSKGAAVDLDGWQQGAVSAIPAVALALSLHLLIILIEAISEALGRRKTRRTEPASVRTQSAPETRTTVVAEPVRTPAPEPVRPALPEPVRTPETIRTPPPYGPRTEPPRTDDSSLVRARRTGAEEPAQKPRTGDEDRTEPARPVAPKPARAAAAKTATTAPKPPKTLVKTPPATVDRDALVAELASDIATTGDDWKPDYEALMARTGYGRSWCEKVVKDAREDARGAAETPRMQAASETRTPARTDAAQDVRTGSRTDVADEPRTEAPDATRTGAEEASRTGDARPVLRAVR